MHYIIHVFLLYHTCFATNILIFGGNGMIGSTAVLSLLQSPVPHNLTLVSRGNWYWDTAEIVKPFVKHIQCTREDGFREECANLAKNNYDVIIDFSAYDPLDIEDVLILLRGKFKRYIYISSDSVYEVCQTKKHNGYWREEDALRPSDEKERLTMSARDSYGDKKLQGEEVLKTYHKLLKFDYISLRLADVLGPRDNTYRCWKYYMWVKMHKSIGALHIPKHLEDVPLSFTSSKDVGALIARLVDSALSKNLLNTAYNLAFREPITLKKYFEIIGKFVNKGDISFNETEAAKTTFGFPSVSRGPINISKAVNVLEWQPTSIYNVVREACQFYEEAEYVTSYKYILDHVLDKLGVRGVIYRDFLNLHYDKITQKKNVKQEL